MLKALLAACLLSPAPAFASAIDLHLHLPMIEKQVNLKDLEAADVRLIVAVAYAPPVLSQLLRGGYANEVLRQFAKIRRWAARDPRVVIVRTPDEAEAVLKSKEWRLGVILAAEGAGGADTIPRLETLWNAGLRMLTIAHFKSTSWGGAAAVRYWPWASCVPGGKDNGRRSPRGLSGEGEKLADWAVAKGLILDLTHASDKTAFDLARRHPELPLLFSHEAARELTPCERTISPELLREVKRSHGLVGLTLAANYAGGTMESLKAHAAALARDAGAESVTIGSDFNGLIEPIGGAEGPSRYAAVLKEMLSAGIPADRSAEAFVGYWRTTRVVRPAENGGTKTR
ncbi:MAG: membrane dipeptidase [Elusimicrobia bacterium]|nr:membrane dipeptidase [Elusimicrobiota bacterium]